MSTRIVFYTIILISFTSACTTEKIQFVEDNPQNIHLGCYNSDKEEWRNVILDRQNNSIRSEGYFIFKHLNEVMKHGTVWNLKEDEYHYVWGETRTNFDRAFKLDRVSLKLKASYKFEYSTGVDYTHDYFYCKLLNNYSQFQKWDKDKLRLLEIERKQIIEARNKKKEARKI